MWVWILSIVWLLATAAGIAILSLGVWRKGRWARWSDVLELRWVLIVWFVFTAASYFVNMVLAMTDDEYAGMMYLRQPRAVDVTLAEIADYVARDSAWIVGLVILAFGLWRWSRLAQWAVGVLLAWWLVRGVWGLVRFVIRWPEIATRMELEWSSLWIWPGSWLLMRSGELWLMGLMLLWLVQPQVRARFAEGGALRAAV